MNLIRKGHRHSHRGVIGIESAIVLIAFVIVAAALAFVVLNMGFATTQKAKTSIVATLGEAGSTLEVSGKVIGFSNLTAGTQLQALAIPIKLASGGESVNLQPEFTSVKIITDDTSYDDVYQNAFFIAGPNELSMFEGFDVAPVDGVLPDCNANPIPGPDVWSGETSAHFYFTNDLNGNLILDQGENGVLAVCFAQGDAPDALDKIKVELIPSAGAALTVERQVPNISTDYVDLG